MRDTAGRLPPFPVVVAMLGIRDYLATYGTVNLWWTVPSRAVLATVFFTLLGGVIAGQEGLRYAFAGAAAFACTGATLNRVSAVIVEDRWQGCLYRLRLGRTPILAIMLGRGLVYLAEGVSAAACGILLAGPILVGSDLTARAAAGLPVVAVGAASCLCLGMFLAAASVGRRADLLVGNLASFAVLVASAAVVPLPDSGPIPTVAGLVPLHHSLVALRSLFDGGPVAVHLLAEVTVAAGWLALAWVLLQVQAARARRAGYDEYG